MKKIFFFVAISTFGAMVNAQQNRIDVVGPLSPQLAAFGQFNTGVTTINVTSSNAVDVINTPRGGDTEYYDRTLTLEIWYPANLIDQDPGTSYEVITRNPNITAVLIGRAVRDAEPLVSEGPYPLVILSHGYPGNRFLMSHTGENLASKGYVVAAIDHKESTYEDQQAITSTLYNRPLDQRFVLNSLAQMSSQSAGLLGSMIDAENTGIIGYSMGGYGLVNNLGGGFSEQSVSGFIAPPNRLLEAHATSNSDYRTSLDSRIKAGFAVAPWGMNAGFWEPQDLAGIRVPTFYLAGDQDSVAGYENGTKGIFDGAVNSDRFLLTFIGAGHNAGAPIPVPEELDNEENIEAAGHYRDQNWDNIEMNNIMDHYVTAWFDLHLKGIIRQSALEGIPTAYQNRLSIQHKSKGE